MSDPQEEKVVDVPGFGPVSFPGSMSDDDISAAIQKQVKGSSDPSQSTAPQMPSDSGRLQRMIPAGMTISAYLAGQAKPLVEEFATNPNIPKLGSKIGRVIGGLSPPIGGLVEGGPVGGLVGLAASARGAWAGGKAGWFTAKLAQELGIPAAKVLSAVQKVAPAIGITSAESDALSNLNSPEEMKKLLDAMTPEAKDALMKHLSSSTGEKK